jgi:7,8-dihydro-6-hydroxymethylpterin dimethyltransferase
VLREDGTLIPTTQFDDTMKSVHPRKEDAAEQAREYVRRHWKYYEPKSGTSGRQCGCEPSAENLLERAQSHFLCISGMAFQDAWNIDLERLRRCCIHVVTADLRLVPFCAYYVTDSKGRRLAK